MYLKINFNRRWHWEKCWQCALSNWSIFSTHGEKVHSFHTSRSIHWKRKRCSLSTKLSSVTVKPICLMHVERVRALRLDLKFQRSKKKSGVLLPFPGVAPSNHCASNASVRVRPRRRNDEMCFHRKGKKKLFLSQKLSGENRHSLNLTFALKFLFLRNKKAMHPYSSSSHAVGYEHTTNVLI